MRTPFLSFALIYLWTASVVCVSVFYSSPKAHMLLRSRRANTFLEELKAPSFERECIEERCSFEEAKEIYTTTEAALRFWVFYEDSTYTNCSVDNGGCYHNCHERKDKTGRFCSCIKGYTLQEDFKQCAPKNQQSCGQILIAKSFYRSKPIEGLQPWLVGGDVGYRGESPWQDPKYPVSVVNVVNVKNAVFNSPEKFVHALVLNAKGDFHCGGVLIDESWVLTAAHCLEGFTRFGVRLGDYKRFEFEGSEVTLPVVKIVPHPNYNSLKADNDIALLRLKSPITFSTYIVPACLPSQDLAERVLHLNGTMMVVTGWGKDKEGTKARVSELQHINVPLLERSECARYMTNNLTENVLCAGSIGSIKDACSGDSGGPMMTLYRNTWFLVGLVSWGEGCGHVDKLGIYTKVSNYLEWIDSVRNKL